MTAAGPSLSGHDMDEDRGSAGRRRGRDDQRVFARVHLERARRCEPHRAPEDDVTEIVCFFGQARDSDIGGARVREDPDLEPEVLHQYIGGHEGSRCVAGGKRIVAAVGTLAIDRVLQRLGDDEVDELRFDEGRPDVFRPLVACRVADSVDADRGQSLDVAVADLVAGVEEVFETG